MTDKMREDFEAHIAEMIISEAGLDIALHRDAAGDYDTSWVQSGWQFWQAATRQANQWRPIADAPKDGTEILVLGTRHEMLLPNPKRMVAAYRRGWWSGGDVVSHLTSWLPLPPTGTEPDFVLFVDSDNSKRVFDALRGDGGGTDKSLLMRGEVGTLNSGFNFVKTSKPTGTGGNV